MDKELLQLGTEPVSADAPTGIAVRYEPEFEQLQAEMSKLEAVSGASIHWDDVVNISSGILADKSKDLLVSCYLCHGLYEKHGYAGLSDGLMILAGLVDTFWENLFPEMKRKRARIGAIEWLVERLGPLVSERKPKAGDQEAIAICKRTLEQLEVMFAEKLGDQAVSLSDLYRPVRDYDSNFVKQTKKQASDSQASTTDAASGHQKPDTLDGQKKESTPPVNQDAGPQTIASERDVNKAMRSCRETLRNVATFQRSAKISDPLSYRLLRMATWLNVQLPIIKNNLTEVRQIPPERLTFIMSQVQAGDHIQIIQAVEDSLFNAPFWLDAHRLTATALESLGHKEAQQAVIIGLATFLRRFPALLDCKFVGEVPFADDETRQWIDNEVATGGSMSVGSVLVNSIESSEGAAPWLEVSDTANSLAEKGKIKEAIKGFQDGRQQASSRRDRFLWDLYLARFCQGAGHYGVAISLLEFLDDEVNRYQLEDWEPDLSLEIALLMLVCYDKLGIGKLTPERSQRQQLMLSRVSRLDTAIAIGLQKKTK